MDDIKIEIGSLQDLLLKPVRFLEEKFNEMKDISTEKFKQFSNAIDSIKATIEGYRKDLMASRMAIKANEKSISELKHAYNELSSEYAESSEKNVKQLDYLTESMAIAKMEIRDVFDLAEANHDEQKKISAYLQAIHEDIADMRTAAAADRSFCQEVKRALSEMDKKEACLKQEFKDELEKCRFDLDARCDAQKIRFAHIEKLSEDIESRIKRGHINLSEALDHKFDRFSRALDIELLDDRKVRKEVVEKVEYFEHKMLKAMQSGKVGKDLDDFIKQVSYNAQQIARIQRALDEG